MNTLFCFLHCAGIAHSPIEDLPNLLTGNTKEGIGEKEREEKKRNKRELVNLIRIVKPQYALSTKKRKTYIQGVRGLSHADASNERGGKKASNYQQKV